MVTTDQAIQYDDDVENVMVNICEPFCACPFEIGNIKQVQIDTQPITCPKLQHL